MSKLSQTSIKREKLFDYFSNDLKQYLREQGETISYKVDDEFVLIKEDIYICPLCLHGFLKASLYQSYPNPLTLEHVPPRNSGGKPIVLLCKKCNNDQGRINDHIIPKMMEMEPFIRNETGSSIKGRISLFNGSNLPFNLVKSSNESFTIDLGMISGLYLQQKLKSLFSDGEKHEGRFSVPLPNKYKYIDSLLRTAYLLGFEHLGYSFIFNSNMNKVREHLINPNENNLPHSSLAMNICIKDFKIGIHKVIYPKEFRCYAVMFKTKSLTFEKLNMVFLPAPYEWGWECYGNIKYLNNTIQLQFVTL